MDTTTGQPLVTEGITDHLNSPALNLQYMYVVPICVLMVASAASNILLIVTITRCRHLHTTSNSLLLQLGIIDLLIAIFVLPPWVWVLWTSSIHYRLCQAVGFITMLLFLQSLSSVAVISIDRYLRICHPMQYQEMVTRKRLVIVVMATWLIDTLLSSAPFYNFGKYTLQPSSIMICSAEFKGQKGYSSMVLGITIIPAFVLITVSYCKIFITARHQARQIADVRVSISSPNQNKTPSPAPNNECDTVSRTSSFQSTIMRVWNDFKRSVSSRRAIHPLWQRAQIVIRHSMIQNRALKTVLTVIGCFVACWLPYIILILHLSLGSGDTVFTVEYSVTFLAFSSSLLNPITCALTNKDYRRALLLSLGIGREEREIEIKRRVVIAMTPSRVQESPQYMDTPAPFCVVKVRRSDCVLPQHIHEHGNGKSNRAHSF